MKRACLTTALAFAVLASPAQATTVANGVVIFNHADVMAGGITPGDAPGYPATISVSGSYRLAGNLVPPRYSTAINVTASEVTIDLFGFRIAGSGTASVGIASNQRALTVTNGTIRGMTGTAISSSGEELTVTNMRLSSVQSGIETTGARAMIRGNNVVNVIGVGVSCKGQCRIEGNNISGNFGATGVDLDSGIVIDNSITNNTTGLWGHNTPSLGGNDLLGNLISINGAYKAIGNNACGGACPTPDP